MFTGEISLKKKIGVNLAVLGQSKPKVNPIDLLIFSNSISYKTNLWKEGGKKLG